MRGTDVDGTAKRLSRRAVRWMLLLASTTLACLCAEGLLRIGWHNPYVTEAADRVVRLRLQNANTDHRIDRSSIHPDQPQTWLRTDARSYIRPSFQHVRPDCTIAFLGGSTTECCAVQEHLRFPALVSQQLGEQGWAVNTLNAGCSGNCLHDSLNLLLNHVVKDRPDIVVLMHACNDIGLLSELGSYNIRAEQYMGWADVGRTCLMRLSNYSHTAGLLRQVLRERRAIHPTAPENYQPLARQELPEALEAEFEQRLRSFIQVCHAFSITPVVMTQPISPQVTRLTPQWANRDVQVRFNDLIRRVGADERVQVIDLVAHLQDDVADWEEHMNLFYDGMHVTDRGSQVYGDYIADQLLPLVERAPSATRFTRRADSDEIRQATLPATMLR